MPSAGHVKWAKFRVLAVSLAAASVLGTMVYLLTGGSLLQQRARIYLYIPDATGLEKGSPVRVDGIDVGKVSAVELTGSNQPDRIVRVTLAVTRERLASFTADSVAQLSADSLVGDQFVDVTSGTAAQAIRDGGELIYKVQPDLVKSLDLTQFTQQLRVVDAVLTDLEQGRSQFGKFFQGTEFYNDLSKRLHELHAGIRAAVGANTAVGNLLTSDQMHRQAGDLLARLDQSLAQLESGQGDFGRLLRDSGQYEQLLASMRDLHKSVAALGGGPLLESEVEYAEWNQKLAGWIQSVDELNTNPMLLTPAVYENLSGEARQLRDTLREFRQNPRKYLRLKIF
ncbi:MAG: MlaD family protein [Bryobacteraceae bacterium]|jgi:phospholipid/cholesterol/gamma-HCH transport system substrate-binding protein